MYTVNNNLTMRNLTTSKITDYKVQNIICPKCSKNYQVIEGKRSVDKPCFDCARQDKIELKWGFNNQLKNDNKGTSSKSVH